MGKWNPVSGQSLSINMEATEAISAGDPVKLATNGIAVAGDGDSIIGVAAADIASGAVGAIWLDGVYSVTFAATIAMGAVVYAAASGQVDGGSATNHVCGLVVDFDATSGSRGNVLLTSDRFNTFPHA